MRAPRDLDRTSNVRVAEPLVRLAALPPRDGSAAVWPSYEERTGALVRRAAPPEGLRGGELAHVWERLTSDRRFTARPVLASWTWVRWTLAVAVLSVSGAAVAAVTGAWTWPRIVWHQVEGSSLRRSPGGAPDAKAAKTARPARSLAVTGHGLAPRASEPTSPMAPPAMPVPVVVAAPDSPVAAQSPSLSPAPSRGAPAGSPRPSAVVERTPRALAAARPGDLALAEEGELLGRALARLRQAHDASGAIADLDRYAERFPSGVLHREAQTARVDALLMAGRSSEARRVLAQLTLGVDARDRELRLIRAELAAESAPASALEDFRVVWVAHPSGATGERSLWGMAACHDRLGDEAATRAALELYLARFPDGPHAAAARTARRD